MGGATDVNRWTILAVLFAARTAMAFQFQSLAALSPFVIDAHGLGLADIGLLIGLYLAPGALVAMPGSALSARLGDKRVVTAGLLMMTLGAAMTLLPSEGWLTASRLVAGAGGVLLNIVMTKMLIDWFQGREVATAMAIFINSWPVGIALASATLPVFAEAGGLTAAWWATLAATGGALILFQLYKPAPAATAAVIERRSLPWARLTCAGLVWALYNAALAVVFSFGALLLVGRGLTPEGAGGIVSLYMLVFAIFAPLGGVLADRIGRPDGIAAISSIAFLVCLPAIALSPWQAAVVILIALAPLSAISAGPIMTLPGTILAPQARAFGMGVFFTIYYVVMMVAPRIAGGIAERAGDPAAAFHVGAVFAALAILSLALFRRGASKPGTA